MFGRILIFVYGVVCYFIFLGRFLYAIGFLGNFVVSKGIDGGELSPRGPALLINVVLLGMD